MELLFDGGDFTHEYCQIAIARVPCICLRIGAVARLSRRALQSGICPRIEWDLHLIACWSNNQKRETADHQRNHPNHIYVEPGTTQ